MSDNTKIALAFFAMVVAVMIFGTAGEVVKARAKAAQACFEAAKVNHNIKCESAK